MDEKRLGRGLRSLLSSTSDAGSPEVPTDLPVAELRPNRLQPRSSMSEEGIKALSESIRKHGILQPIVVRRSGGSFEIVAGERRWRAAKLAGIETVPVRLIEQQHDAKVLEIALVENIQREDLDPISKAKAMRQLVEVFGVTQEKVAVEVGLDRSTVANALRLLDLPAEVQELVSRGTISAGHARAILALENPERMIEVAKAATEKHLSVRQVEDLTRRSPSGTSKTRKGRTPLAVTEPWVKDLEARLRSSVGCRVEITSVGSGWRLSISCSDQDELHRVAEGISRPLT
ncbi:MAG TPA: ParB/RepB/Spo0J family partition protein [Planctomycetota bacterium]|jgi:ParB family chromosome partitioning protein|nr:ParB/RepB/Spo0J family partition protein [Planctomycetota bacterium]